MTQDIRESGEMNYKDLQKENLYNFISSPEVMSSLRNMKRGEIQSSSRLLDRDYTDLAIATGFGDSRYDVNFTSPEEVNDNRARAQSVAAKLGAGAAKFATITGTSFLDGKIGSVIGVMSGLANLFDDDKDTTFWKGFINNPLSLMLNDLNKWTEKVLPNYRTQDEIENPWKHVWSANFWGDTVLKNLGYMVGMGLSGKIAAGNIGKLLQMDKVRNAFKGAVVAAGGKGDDAAKVLKTIKTGDALIDGMKFTDELAKSAKKLATNEKILALAGSVVSAFGEARQEAINNTSEWMDYHMQLINDDKENTLANIDKTLSENPEFYDNVLVEDPELGYTYKKQLNQKGQVEKERLIAEADDKQGKAIEIATKEGAKMANTIFGLNVGLLTFGNVVQFGKFFAGGFKTGKLAAAKGIGKAIEGNVKEGFTLYKEMLKHPTSAIKNVFTESNEEMAQSFIGETAGLSAASKLNTFYGHKLDPDAEDRVVNFIKASTQGIKNTYGDKNSWIEGFVGGLSSLAGLPGIVNVKQADGTYKKKIRFNGAISEMLDIVKENKEAQKIVDDLNKLVRSKEFLDRYNSAIGHESFQKEMDLFLKQGKEFNYKNSELGQFINDVLLFQKAGRIQDLYDYAEQAGAITEDNIEELKQLGTDKTTGKSMFDGMTDDEVLKHVEKQRKKYLDKLKSFQEISANLKILYGNDVDEDVLEELTWMTAQIGDWEQRGKQLHDEIVSALKGKVQNIEKVTGEEIDLSSLNYIDLLELFDSESDSSILAKINNIVNDHNLSVQEQSERINKAISDLTRVVNDEHLAVARKVKEAKKRGASEGEIEKIKEKEKYAQKTRKTKALSAINNYNEYLKNLKEVLDPVTINDLGKKRDDLIKIIAARTYFINKYNSIAAHPEEFTTEAIDMKKQAIKKVIEKETKAIAVKAMSAKDIFELETVLSEASDSDSVIEKLEKEGSPETKQIVKNLKDLTEASSLLTDILEKRNPSPELLSARNIISAALQSARTLDEVKSIINEYINKEGSPQEVRDELNAILNELETARKSAAAAKADTKKNEDSRKATDNKNPKDSKKPDDNLSPPSSSGSVFDSMSDSPVQDDDGDLGAGSTGSPTTASTSEELPDTSPENKKHNEEVKKERSIPNVHNGSQQGVPAQKEKNVAPESGYEQGLRSWVDLLYDYKELKDPDARRKVLRSSPLINALVELGAFEYVESAKFADKYWKLQREHKELEIKFVLANKNSDLANHVLLTIEVTPEEATDKSIKGHDGKLYQIVGVLGYNGSNSEATLNAKEIRNAIHSENDNSDYFVSQSMYTTVRHLYSGRMVKTDDSINDVVEQRDVTTEFLRGRKFHLGIAYNPMDFRTPTLELNERIESPNTNNQNPREGSIWLMVKEADGVYYPKAVTIKRFNASEYPLSQYGNTPIVQEIKKHLRVLMDPNQSRDARVRAKFALQDLLYFPQDSSIAFKDGTGLVSFGKLNNVGKNASTIDEAVEKAFNALYAGGLDLRFQIAVRKLGVEAGYEDMILKSGIMSTDMLQPNNVNASFDINLVDMNSGQPIIDKNDTVIGHTGSKESRGDETFIFNGDRVIISRGEAVMLWDNNGNLLSKDLSDLIIQTLRKIKSGELSPEEFDNSIYIVKNNLGEEAFALKRMNGGGFNLMDKTALSNLREKAEKKKKEKEKSNAIAKEIEGRKERDAKPTVPYNPNEDASTPKDEVIPEDPAERVFPTPIPEEKQEEKKKEEKEKKKEQGKPKSSATKSDISTDAPKNEEYVKVLRSKGVREALKEMGLSTKEFEQKMKSLGYDITTITTEERAMEYIKQIKDCD